MSNNKSKLIVLHIMRYTYIKKRTRRWLIAVIGIIYRDAFIEIEDYYSELRDYCLVILAYNT